MSPRAATAIASTRASRSATCRRTLARDGETLRDRYSRPGAHGRRSAPPAPYDPQGSRLRELTAMARARAKFPSHRTASPQLSCPVEGRGYLSLAPTLVRQAQDRGRWGASGDHATRMPATDLRVERVKRRHKDCQSCPDSSAAVPVDRARSAEAAKHGVLVIYERAWLRIRAWPSARSPHPSSGGCNARWGTG